MLTTKSRSTQKDRKEKMRTPEWKWILLGMLLLGIGAVLAAVVYEIKTSKLQARKISEYAASLSYSLKAGPSDSIVYPGNGPFDKRLGYSQLPQLLDRIQTRGMKIEYQTRFSSPLIKHTSRGFFTPYREKYQAGLNIIDCQGKSVYQSLYPKRVYARFDSIPPLIIQSLLFIENRELLDTAKPYLNPAVDWERFTRAILQEAAQSIGLNFNRMGGSTLPTQIEKYRHSPGGFTADRHEKLRQMVSASVRAYQGGPETLPARRELVLSYLNSVPLGAASGYGEVHGLGDGLWVWFKTDFNQVNKLLQIREAKGDTLLAQGLALRQILSLLIAQRRPYFFLRIGRAELTVRTGSYLRLMEKNGHISPELRDAGLAQPVTFRDISNDPLVTPQETDKGILMVRTHLSELLNAPLYDLDRLDITATTTLQNDLQEKVSTYLNQLSDPEFARSAGLFGKYLLSPNHTQQVRYSFTLFQSTPQGNLVRVQTDNTDQPFDINEGSKLELGSTAKLRVFVHYLEVIAEIHQRFAGQPEEAWHQALNEPQPNLSRWVLKYLIKGEDKSLPAILRAALERRYSASPWEGFFTGGGMHTFHNYLGEGNGSNPTMREALLKSINLPFVRLMRDLVNYSTYQTAGSTVVQLLKNDHDPRRREYLTRFAEREGKMYLQQFWNKYKDKSPEERFTLFLNGLRQNPVRLAAVHRYLYPETDSVSFGNFLRERLPYHDLTDKRIMELYHRYGPDAFNLPDQGYIARVHPLELWLLDYLLHHPGANWAEVKEAGQDERLEVYKWLFRTRFKHARDSRIRTMLELDAFKDIHQRWKKLGYPFNHLVPSLATALGSSGDRPAALAELMGIILNKGVRQEKVRIEKLHFAANTPYETIVRFSPMAGEQVMAPEVATAVQEALSGVVGNGTASRLRGGFTKADGSPLPMGGKTGTGDNRKFTVSVGGHRMTSRVVNRTATFVFFLGNNHFGTLTAFVPGSDAADFSFTSSLPVQVLRAMAPILEPYLEPGAETLCQDEAVSSQKQVGMGGKI